MTVSEAARNFAIMAHTGQIRKSEPDKPMVIHPIGVAKLLEEYGFDDHVVAAGYLHDIVEDTSYTLDDIKKNFGVDVANLVNTATEPDKSLSWEERKKHTIEVARNIPLRNKAVICADKINNLESLMLLFAKTDKRDFSKFKRGEELQKWYYTSVYESLIQNEDSELPIFKRLKDTIDTVFYDKKDYYLVDTIFQDNLDYYYELKKLHAQKLELEQLKSYCDLDHPFVIEFTGTPRTGKTTTINNLYDFFKKGGFKINVIEEFTSSKIYKESIKKKLESLPIGARNLAILDYIKQELMEITKTDSDIVIIDRSISDRQIWNNIRHNHGELTDSEFYSSQDDYKSVARDLIDYLIITYADALTSLRRDYNSSLALEPRNFLNTQNINEFNASLYDLKGLFKDTLDNVAYVDTTLNTPQETSIEVANDVMPAIRKRYLDSFKRKYQ